jgi:hypothetical protein
MSITYDGKEIAFFKFPVKQVVLALSGGTDSAAILYLICKKFPDVEIIPYNCEDVDNPYDMQAAEKIIEVVKGWFPDNKIRPLVKGIYNDQDETLFPKAIIEIGVNPHWATEKDKANASKEEHIALIKKYQPKSLDYYIEHFRWLNILLTPLIITRVTKTLYLDKLKGEMRAKYPNAYLVNGMTRNPPIEEQKKYPVMYQLAETRRNPNDKIRNTRGPKNVYIPFANVDKKFVAAIYKEEKLMKDIFPLTRSCVGVANLTDNYTKNCHQCFWCYEKKWAFDLKW